MATKGYDNPLGEAIQQTVQNNAGLFDFSRVAPKTNPVTSETPLARAPAYVPSVAVGPQVPQNITNPESQIDTSPSKEGYSPEESRAFAKMLDAGNTEKEADSMIQKRRKDIAEKDGGVGTALTDSFGQGLSRLGDTLGGVATKTGEAFVEGAKGIGSNIQKGASGEIPLDSAIARTVSSGFNTALAPISGILGQGVEETAKVLPDSAREKLASGVQKATDWFSSLPKDQQERLRDIGAGLNIAGSVGGIKISPEAGKLASSLSENIASRTKSLRIPFLDPSTPLATGASKISEIKPLQGIKEFGTRSLPISRVEKDLNLTPTERSTVERTGKTAGQFMLEKNLGGLQKEQQINELQKLSDESYNGTTEKLRPITERSDSEDAKKMLQTMKDEMESSPIVRREMQPYIEKIDELAKQKDYSVLEKLAIRRDFDRIVGKQMFDSKGRISGQEDRIINSWRNGLSDDIQAVAQKNGVDVKALNDDIRNSITIRDGLLRRLSQENKNNTFGLQDIGFGAILSGGEPVTATALIIGKKALEKATPGIAQKLYNLNKAPSVSRNLSRGPSVSARDTTNGMSIAPNTDVRLVPSGVARKKGKKPKSTNTKKK